MFTTGIKTAVFPVAGRGSRFRPATHAVAKELLPVLDTPVLDFAISEARSAGIERFVFVTSDEKPEIQVYVQSRFAELSAEFIVQDEPKGLGHAVLMANRVAEDGPFAVILPDDVIFAAPPVLEQMAQAYDGAFAHHMIAAMEVRPDAVGSYGIFDADMPAPGRHTPINGFVEKPEPEDAPSTLAAVGRYILHPSIFETLLTARPGAGGEIQLTDAIARDLQRMGVAAYRFEGVRFDCGRPEGLLEAGSAVQDARELARQGVVA
jgi:UTP--glucose-1-phosphate uridylyltransferase